MITNITVEKFKGFGDRASISVAPLTLIYGQNSAGKSSIIHSAALIKKTTEESNADSSEALIADGSLVSLGSFEDMVNGHDLRND